MTIISPTLFTNVIHAEGDPSKDGRWIIDPKPSPGLRGGFNRTFALSERGICGEGFDERIADAIVAGNEKQGLRLLACIADAHGDHMRYLAKRYGSRVVWQLGNEPDSDDSEPETTGRVWRFAEDDIRAVAPDAEVILGAIQSLSGHGLRFYREMLAAYGRRPQAISCHVYTDAQRVDQVAERINWLQGVVRSFGCFDVPIDVTEYGEPGSGAWGYSKGLSYHRAMRKQFEAAGVRRALAWGMDDPHWGPPREKLSGWWKNWTGS